MKSEDRVDINIIGGIIDTLKLHEPAFRRHIRDKLVANALSKATEGATEDAALLMDLALQIDVEGPAVGRV
ncbi:hypothetical protein [Novosphingobium sp. B1]|uniref:hypothetical protein n=1 Tax=Novosphingobium sp. B1 TaxID=1938756 RepID=UPI000A009173|nr:hypothetical protein [Novosphingobium sp. B1]